jgi:hypothetical protein
VVIVGSLLLILVAVGLLVAGVVGGSNALIVCCIVAAVLAAVVLVIGVKQSAGADADEADRDEDDASEVTQVRETRSRAGRDTQSGRRSAERAGGSSYGSRGGTLVEERTSSIPTQTPNAFDDATERVANRFTERVDISGGRPDTGGTQTFERYREEPRAEPFEPPAETAAPAAAQSAAPAADADFDDEDPPDEPSAQVVSASQAARVAMLTADVLVVDGRPRYHISGCVHLLGRESEPLPVGEAVELGFTPCGLCEPDSKLLADARRV